jgi:Recombination endonuclease VII
LRRIDENKPYSKTNVRWTQPVANANGDYFTPEERSAYNREWTLNRKFNITTDAYERMFTKQRGCCAICREPETSINRKTGEIQILRVDHDHSTGAVRGLLCIRCNRMLGLSKDKTKILQSAILYLKRNKPHRAPKSQERLRRVVRNGVRPAGFPTSL